MVLPPEDEGDDEGESGRKRKSQADRLVELAGERYTFYRSADGDPFALPRGGPAVARILRGSRSLRAELAALYAETAGKAPSSQALTDALLVLEGRCLSGDVVDVSLRVSATDGLVALDLGRDDGVAAVVDGEGWHLESTPAVFRRLRLTGRLPEPEGPGDLDALRGFLNITDEDWGLLVAWLVSCLVPDVPAPIVLLTGEQGSAKSYAARLLVRLVDPSAAELRSEPRDVTDWAVAASGSWLVAVDNVSKVRDWFSDALCRAATGDGLVRRALYTDSDVSVLSFRRRIILTSIDPGAMRGDLADRLLPVDLERIPEDRRREERELERAFAEVHPRILAGLLDLAAQVYDALPEVQMDRLPRMADFARICAAVDHVLGAEVLKTYLVRAREVVGNVVEADPVARAIRDYVAAVGPLEVTAAELLEILPAPEPRPKRWPDTPQAMGGALKRLAPALRAVGIEVDQLPRNNSRRPWSLSGEKGYANERHERHPWHDQGVLGDDPVTTPPGASSHMSRGRHGVSAGHAASDECDEEMHTPSLGDRPWSSLDPVEGRPEHRRCPDCGSLVHQTTETHRCPVGEREESRP